MKTHTTHPEDQLALPADLDAITAEWLTSALSIRYPGTEVKSVFKGTVVHGTGTKVRLLLEYNARGHEHRLPPTMWLKGGYEPHTEMVISSHANEARFYRDIAPARIVNCPTCYFSGSDGTTGISVQLLEDLLNRNVNFTDAAHPVSVDLARRVLDMMARYHAYWWGSDKLDGLGQVGGSLRSDGIMFRLIDDGLWEEWMTTPRAANVPAVLRTGENIKRALMAMWEVDRTSTRCIVHGDAHPGNLFLEPDGTPGYLDWQRLMQCNWAHDVSYFLIGSLTVDDCVQHERELVAYYLKQRQHYGAPEASFEDSFLSYRQHVLHGLLWVAVPTAMQTEEIVTASSLRFGAAAERLKSFEALGLA